MQSHMHASLTGSHVHMDFSVSLPVLTKAVDPALEILFKRSNQRAALKRLKPKLLDGDELAVKPFTLAEEMPAITFVSEVAS